MTEGRFTADDAAALHSLIRQAKLLARRYHALTGRPLGITGEIAEYEAARLLKLELAAVRQAGYDVVRRRGTRRENLQVKGRCVLSKNLASGSDGSISRSRGTRCCSSCSIPASSQLRFTRRSARRSCAYY